MEEPNALAVIDESRPDESDTAMDDTELATMLAQYEDEAVGYYDSEIASEQANSINYYYGIMDDLPASDGGSHVVEHTVAVMVDNAIAAALKPFVSADEVVSFEPRQPEDVEIAEQATEYVNYVINVDNRGFMLLHDWMKDGLLTKLGIVKTWWDDQTRYEVSTAIVTAEQLLFLRQDPNYLGEKMVEPGIFEVSIQQEVPDGRQRIENVPPEEFLVSRYARNVEDCPYIAHRPNDMTRSDLIELGIPATVADGLPAHAYNRNEEQRQQARYRDEEWESRLGDTQGADKAQDVVGVLDEYVRVDYDGDGIAELRRIIRVNDQILFNEEWDEIPFAVWCPIPMPHKLYGRSFGDVSMQQQKASTAVLRQTLENLYKTNNPRPVVGDSAMSNTHATLDDLYDNSPGAAIRVSNLQALDWLTVPFTADKSYSMLEYMAQAAEERTGVQRKGVGLNSEALKKNSADTATQASIDENSRTERMEMVARIFAETGLSRLFKLILKSLVENQPKARLIKLRNKWVEMDPSGWDAEMDVSISVGLGVGSKMEQIQQANVILDTYERLGQTPFANLLDANKVRKGVARLFNAAGIKNVDDYLNDPDEMSPQEPPPDPEMAKVQADAQAKMQQQRFDMVMREREQQHKEAVEVYRAERDADLKDAKANFEARLAEQKAYWERQLAEMKAQMEAKSRTDLPDNRPGGDLDK